MNNSTVTTDQKNLPNTRIKLIIAIDKNGVMGIDNKLPWRLSEDLKQFKKETDGYPLIMGSATFKSLPGILPNREHLVLSKSLYGDEDKSVFTSIKELIDYLNDSGYESAYVIGGANVISQFTYMNLIDELIITHVDCEVEGDTILNIDTDLKIHSWSLYRSEKYTKNEKNQYSFTINRYTRTKKRFY